MKAKRRSAGAEGHYLKWMLAIMVIVILLALLVPGVSAEWYQREVTINNGDSALTGYHVLVTLESGDYVYVDPNGDSIRFTNIANDQKYDYWIEDWNDGGTSKIWVEVPEVPNGDSKMYLWSNADGASPDSNGDATFQFFDDFPLPSIDTNKWIITEPGWSIVSGGGELKGKNANGRLTSTSTFSDGVILEIKSRYKSLPGGSKAGYQIGGFFSSTSNAFGFLNHDSPDYYYRTNGDPWVALEGIVPASPTNLLTKISVKPANSVDLSVTNYDTCVSYHSVSATNTVSGEPIALGKRYDDVSSGQTYEAYWDWIRVRKYASTEPTITDMGTPKSTAEQPVPELPTVILFSVGLIVLAGYVLLRRREKKKGE